MALFPNKMMTQFRLQPGANGEVFVANQPGYRDGALRINRSNNRFNLAVHEALSQKYIMDTRLKPLFKYGFAVGYNYMIAPKGRIVAGDPHRDAIDWTSDKKFNTLTLANGGVPVRLRAATDVYPTSTIVSSTAQGQKVNAVGLDWIPVDGLDDHYEDGVYRSCLTSPAAALTAAGYKIDDQTGNVADKTSGVVTTEVRPGNVPLGMLGRNEYTRFENDSMDGKQPAPVLTDACVELPLFAFKDKAEENPWGSAYGNIAVGDLVKSDENGRFTISPLSNATALDAMDAAEIERERQQVMGQVIGVNHDMVPEGGYKYAQWALEERMKFEGFAPDMYTQTNRPGEDVVNSSAYQSTGRYPGYPYDHAYSEHDLQMLGSTTGRGYNKFLQDEYYLDGGIPGLTDGANVAIKNYENNNAAVIRGRADSSQEFIKHFVKIAPQGNVVDGSVQIQLMQEDIATGTKTQLVAFTTVDSSMALPKALTGSPFQVEYYNAVQGMIVLSVADEAAADTLLASNRVIVNLKYQKRGMAGVPTFMDWDGCVGSVKILLQR